MASGIWGGVSLWASARAFAGVVAFKAEALFWDFAAVVGFLAGVFDFDTDCFAAVPGLLFTTDFFAADFLPFAASYLSF